MKGKQRKMCSLRSGQAESAAAEDPGPRLKVNLYPKPGLGIYSEQHILLDMGHLYALSREKLLFQALEY